jgi:hypothetical protein
MFNKEDIIKIEFTEKTDYYELEYIALFNKTKISDDEVKKSIRLHRMGEHPCVIFMSKEQFENVFR